MGLAEQKKIAFKEQVTFFSDETRTRPVFAFSARKVMDFSSGYDITDEAGQQIGFFRKDFGASLLRSTFHLEGPGYAGTGQERSQLVALLRRFTEVPLPADPLRLRRPRRRSRCSASSARPRVRDRYTVTVPDDRRRLPGGRGAGRRPRRSDAAVGRWCSSRRPAAPSRRRRMTSRSTATPSTSPPSRAQARAAALAEPARGVAEVRDLDADGVPCRLYRPAGAADGLVVHLHGGGFVFHDVEVHDAPARRLANRCGLAVLSVDYRRPPEHRFPAAPDDVDTVLAWLDRAGAARTAWTGPTFVHGDSAGGNLALVAALRHPGRFRAVALVYPFLDPTAGFESYRTAAARLRPARGRVVLAAVRRHAGRPRAPRPRAAALRPARARLPPTLVVTAEHDPLRDEGEHLARRLAEAGVEVVGDPLPRPGPRLLAPPERFPPAEPLMGQVAATSASTSERGGLCENPAMRVHLGSDHAGLDLKDHLLTWLADHGHEVVDHGPFVYDAARRLPGLLPAGRRGRGRRARRGARQPRRRDRRLRQRRADGGQQGRRASAAALVWSEETAVLAREHNDANVVSVGGRMHTLDEMTRFVEVFLATAVQRRGAPRAPDRPARGVRGRPASCRRCPSPPCGGPADRCLRATPSTGWPASSTRAFAGRVVRVGSPQGRFADAAALLDGRRVEGAEAWGKHLFVEFAGERFVHVHLGLYGKLRRPPRRGGGAAAGRPGPAAAGPTGAAPAYADLRGATACDLVTREQRDAVVARSGPTRSAPDADPVRGVGADPPQPGARSAAC